MSITFYSWCKAPKALRDMFIADPELNSFGDEDYILVSEGTTDDEEWNMGLLIDKMATYEGNYKEIDGRFYGFTCHA